jgi:hypothetical protein
MAYRFAVGTVDVSQKNPAVLSIHSLALLENLFACAAFAAQPSPKLIRKAG